MNRIVLATIFLVFALSLTFGCGEDQLLPSQEDPQAEPGKSDNEDIDPLNEDPVADENERPKEPSEGPQDVFAKLVSQSRLGEFGALIQDAGLTEVLQTEAGVTLFAPEDAAMGEFMEKHTAEKGKGLSPEYVERLRQRLFFHIVPGVFSRESLESGDMGIPTLSKDPLKIEVIQSRLKVNGSNLVDGQSDIEAKNGLIHVIDEFLAPPLVYLRGEMALSSLENLKNSPNFSEFVRILEETGLSSYLAGDAPFTILAPTNQALERISEKDRKNSKLMKKHFKRYLIAGETSLKSLLETVKVTTLHQRKLTVQRRGQFTRAGKANVIQSDFVTRNGRVHVIDSPVTLYCIPSTKVCLWN